MNRIKNNLLAIKQCILNQNFYKMSNKTCQKRKLKIKTGIKLVLKLIIVTIISSVMFQLSHLVVTLLIPISILFGVINEMKKSN